MRKNNLTSKISDNFGFFPLPYFFSQEEGDAIYFKIRMLNILQGLF